MKLFRDISPRHGLFGEFRGLRRFEILDSDGRRKELSLADLSALLEPDETGSQRAYCLERARVLNQAGGFNLWTQFPTGKSITKRRVEFAREAFPLHITFAGMGPDPILLLRGDNWHSNFWGPWTLRGTDFHLDIDDTRAYTGTDEYLTDADVAFLIGHDVIGITSDPNMIAFTLHLSGNLNLAVITDQDEYEPWLICLPERYLVGTLHPEP